VVQPVSQKQLRAVWDALVFGRPAPPQIADMEEGGSSGGGGGDSALALTARAEKQVKQRLTVAADHFNRDYRKGFQYLQVGAFWGCSEGASEACRKSRAVPDTHLYTRLPSASRIWWRPSSSNHNVASQSLPCRVPPDTAS